jgi:hypothetical protein
MLSVSYNRFNIAFKQLLALTCISDSVPQGSQNPDLEVYHRGVEVLSVASRILAGVLCK